MTAKDRREKSQKNKKRKVEENYLVAHKLAKPRAKRGWPIFALHEAGHGLAPREVGHGLTLRKASQAGPRLALCSGHTSKTLFIYFYVELTVKLQSTMALEQRNHHYSLRKKVKKQLGRRDFEESAQIQREREWVSWVLEKREEEDKKEKEDKEKRKRSWAS